MNRRKLIGIVASVAVALVGTMVLISYAGSSSPAPVAEPVKEEVVKVVTAKDANIPAGTTGAALAGMVELVDTPRSQVDGRAALTLESLTGKIVRTEILAKTQVLEAALTTEPTAVALTAAPGTSSWADDLIEISIDLPSVRALRGKLNIGDRVVIYASFVPRSEAENFGVTHTLAYDVPISACEIAPNVPCSSQTVTPVTVAGQVPVVASGNVSLGLMVTPEAAEKIVFASIRGDLWLGRHPRVADSTYSVPAEATSGGNVLLNPPSVNPLGRTELALTEPTTTVPGANPAVPGANPAAPGDPTAPADPTAPVDSANSTGPATTAPGGSLTATTAPPATLAGDVIELGPSQG